MSQMPGAQPVQTGVIPTAQLFQPPHYVSFSAEIVPQSTEALIAAMAQCANQNVKEVCLLLSTPGGTVMNGLNIYNVLRAFPFELTTHNVGNVDSIGNAVFWQDRNATLALTQPSCSMAWALTLLAEHASKRNFFESG